MTIQIQPAHLVVLGVALLAACSTKPETHVQLEATPVTAHDPAVNMVPAGALRVVKNGVEYFCLKETLTGSRVNSRTTCLTASEWANFTLASQEFVRRTQQTGTLTPKEGQLCYNVICDKPAQAAMPFQPQ